MRPLISARGLALVVALVCGCGGGSKPGLRLTLIDSSVQRPSNVAVYFTVDTSQGEPVPGLTADSFEIYEDGRPVSALESKKTILNPRVAAAHVTLLLIDMSGSVTESGDVPLIVAAARGFASRVEKYQQVAVYAFDGSKDIHRIAPFSTGAQLASGIDRLADFKPRDPSTNLNGAVVAALDVLAREMRSAPQPLSFGTLVVFTDGTDRAHRVLRAQLHDALEAAEMDVLVIGVGAEIDSGELQSIGQDGAILSKDRTQVAQSFEAAAARVEAFSRRYYLLGYCSPARAGEHEVRILSSVGGRRGSLRYRYDARGFGPNCDPTRNPSFNVKRPSAPKPTTGPAVDPEGGRFDD